MKEEDLTLNSLSLLEPDRTLTDLPSDILHVVASSLMSQWSQQALKYLSMTVKSTNAVCMERVEKLSNFRNISPFFQPWFDGPLPIGLFKKFVNVREMDLRGRNSPRSLEGIPLTLTSLSLGECHKKQKKTSYPPLDLSPLIGCTGLTSLHLCQSRNRVTDISIIGQLLMLKVLDLTDCQVSSISPLTSCSLLQDLNIRSTQVTDLTPLASCEVLETLDCSRTGVRDVFSLVGTRLTTLTCHSTLIEDVFCLSACTELQRVICRGDMPGLKRNWIEVHYGVHYGDSGDDHDDENEWCDRYDFNGGGRGGGFNSDEFDFLHGHYYSD